MMNGLNKHNEILPVTSIPAVKGLNDEQEQANFFKIEQDNWDDDFNTQQSTPSKEPIFSKIDSPNQDSVSHFSNSFASDEIQPFESDEKYELVQKI